MIVKKTIAISLILFLLPVKIQANTNNNVSSNILHSKNNSSNIEINKIIGSYLESDKLNKNNIEISFSENNPIFVANYANAKSYNQLKSIDYDEIANQVYLKLMAESNIEKKIENAMFYLKHSQLNYSEFDGIGNLKQDNNFDSYAFILEAYMLAPDTIIKVEQNAISGEYFEALAKKAFGNKFNFKHFTTENFLFSYNSLSNTYSFTETDTFNFGAMCIYDYEDKGDYYSVKVANFQILPDYDCYEILDNNKRKTKIYFESEEELRDKVKKAVISNLDSFSCSEYKLYKMNDNLLLGGCKRINNTSESTWNVILNGNKLEFQQEPINDGNRVLVSIREISEGLGCNVDWIDKYQCAVIQRGLNTIIMQIDNLNLYNSKRLIKLDVSPKKINGKTMVPVRALAEIFGAKVDVVEKNTIIITCTDFTEDMILKDFTQNGFTKFNYFGNVFLEKHGNGKYAYLRVLSELGDWSKRVAFFKTKNYQKDIYKKHLGKILSSNHLTDNRDELEKMPEYIEGFSKSLNAIGEIDYDKLKKMEGTDINFEGLDYFNSMTKDIENTVHWSNFTIDQINYFLNDYTKNARYLTVISNALEHQSFSDKDMNKAISELQTDYAHKYLLHIKDIVKEIEDEFGEKVIETIGLKNISYAYSIVTFASEATTKFFGGKEYADNVEGAIAIMPITNNLMWYYQDLANENIDFKGTVSSKSTNNSWNELVSMFYITKAGMIEGYQFMINVTNDPLEKIYLEKQIELLKSIYIRNSIPNSNEKIFVIL